MIPRSPLVLLAPLSPLVRTRGYSQQRSVRVRLLTQRKSQHLVLVLRRRRYSRKVVHLRMCKPIRGVLRGLVRHRSLNPTVSHTINSRTMKQGPDWYNTINPKERVPRGDLQDLKYLLTLIDNMQQDAKTGKDVTQMLNNIRQRLRQMEFLPSLSLVLVKKSGLLHHGGLPLIFENRVQGVLFPSDIRADADILFRKWMSGQIDPHLLRGIVTTVRTAKEGKASKSHSRDKDFTGKVSCNYVGAGNLVNGQWWPLQLCAMRDGAHGEVEAGIHGRV